MPAKRFSLASLFSLALTSSLVAQTTLNFNNGENWGDNIDTSSGKNLTASVASAVATGSISSTIFGDGTVTKTGAGTLVLTGPNTYSGGTLITGGTLSVANASKFGTGDLTATTGGVLSATLLEINGPRTITITGAGSALNTSYLWFNRDNSADLQTLNVLAGGSVTASDTVSFADLNSGSTGNLNVSGTGSSLSATNTIYVGYSGNSTATVADGGTITTNAILSIASLAGSHGTFNLNDGGTLQVGGTGGITIGSASGQFNANGGTIQVIGSDLTSAAAMTLGDSTDSTIDTNGFAASLSGVLSGTGALTKSGTGTLTLVEDNTYTGTTTISAGTLQLGDGSTSGSIASTSIINNGNLTFNSPGSETYAGVISGSGDLDVTGSGSLTLTNANTFSGTTNTDTLLILEHNQALQNSTLVLDGTGHLITNGLGSPSSRGTLYLGGLSGNEDILENGPEESGIAAEISSHLVVGANGDHTTYSGVIDGSDRTFTKTGTGTLTLSGTNTYGGGTTVTGGTLSISDDNNLGEDTGTLTLNGGTLASTATLGLDSNRQVVIGASHGAINTASGTTLTVPDISGAGTLTKTGAGTLAINSYFGASGAVINDGTLRTDASVVLNNSPDITVASGAVFDLNNNDQEIGALAGAGNVTLGSATLTSHGGSPTEFSGDISGTGGLTVGSTLTLSGNNGYSGATTLDGGTLIVGSSTALAGTSSITGDAGATLDLNGYSLTLANVSNDGGAIDLGDTAAVLTTGDANNRTVGAFEGTGSLVKQGSGTLAVTNGFSANIATTVSAGTLDLAYLPVTINSLDGAGNIALESSDLTTGDANDHTLSGVISGTGATLTKSGSGTLTLSGANTYTGATTVASGTLVLASDTALGTTAGGTSVESTGTLAFTNNITIGAEAIASEGTVDNLSGTNSYAGALSGLGNLTVTAGQLTLSGNNTYQGTTAVNGGTLTLGHDNALGATASVDVADGATLDLNDHSVTIADLDGAGNIALGSATLTTGDSNDHALSGEISGTDGSLTKTGSGTLTLTGSNAYTGATRVDHGTLVVSGQDGSIFDTASISIGDSDTATLTVDSESVTRSRSTITLGGSAGGNGTLSVSTANSASLDDTSLNVVADTDIIVGGEGTGNVNVSGGGLVIAAGGIRLGTGDAGSATGTVTITGTDGTSANRSTIAANTLVIAEGDSSTATFTISDGAQAGFASSIEVASGTGSNGTLTVTGADMTAGTHSQLGAVDLFQSGSTPPLTIALATGSGSTAHLNILNGGEVILTDDTANEIHGLTKGDGSATVTLDGGILSTTTGGILTSSVDITTAGSNTLNTDTGTIALSGVISGTGAITKQGSGTLTLSGSNTYDGTTTVSAGTLQLGSTDALGSSAVTVSSDATLDLNGHSVTIDALDGAGNLALGAGALTTGDADDHALSGVISGTGALTKQGVGNLTLSGANTYEGATTVSSGTLTLASNTALGSTAAGTTVDSGATLAFTNDIAVGAEAIANAGTVDNLSGTNSYAGALSGSGNLTVTAGQLNLSGNNSSFSGSTAVNGGTLTLGSTNALGSTSVDLANGAVLDLNDHSVTIADLDTTGTGAIDLGSATLTTGDADDHALTGIISGTGSLTKQGSGNLTLSGANTYEGGTTVTTGTLTGTTSSLQGNIANEAAVVFDQSTTGTYAGVLSGTGSLTKSGSGNVTLSGNNTFSGATAVSNGTLTLASDTALGTIAAGTTVDSGATLAFTNNIAVGAEAITNSGTVDNVSGTNSYAGALSGSGSLAVTAGQLTLSGDNSNFTGTTTLNGGTLSVSTANQLGSSSSALTFNGGTLATTATFTLDSGRGVTLGSNGGTIDTASSTVLSTSGNLSGSGALTKSGEGTLALGGANTYTGGTTVAAGTLDLQTSNALAGSAPVTVASGASIDFHVYGQTFGSIAGAGALNLNSAALSVGSDDTDTTFSGTINGFFGTLTKSGTGTLTLTGDNTYTGQTTINDGTIAIAADSALGAAPFSSNSSQLTLNGGTLLATTDVTLDANRGIYLDSSGGTLESTYATTLTVNGEITGSGNLGIDGEGNVTLARDNAFSGTTTLLDGDATLTLGHVDALKNSTLTTTSGLRFDSSLTSANIGAISGSEEWHSLLLENTADEAVALSVGNNGAATTYEGVISGTGSLTVTGGQLTLAGANTFTGTTTVTNGSLTLANVDALQNSTLNTNGSSTLSFGSLNQANLRGLTGNGSLTLSDSNFTLAVGGDGAYDSTYAGFLTGEGALEKTGTGNLTLTGSNSHRGDTTVSGGTLTIANSTALYDSTLTTVSGGGSVAFSGVTDVTLGGLAGDGDLALPGTVTLQVGQSGKTTTFSGELSGAGNLSVTGGSLTLDHANTLTGTVTPSSGTLVIGHADALQNATLKPDSGTLSFGALTQANVRGLSGSGSLDLNNSNFTLSVGGDGAYDSEFSGTLSGPGSLEKTGTGELILNGYNSMFTGSTTLTGGTVTLGSANALASSTLVTSDGGGALNFGSQTSAYLGGLDGDGTITLNNASSTAVALTVGSSENSSSSTFSGVLAGTGSLTKAGSGTLTLANANTFSGSTTINDGGLTLAHEDALQNSTLNTGSSGMLSFGSLENANVGGIAGSGSITLSSTHVNPFSLTLTGSTDTTYSGELSGGGSLVRSGTGNLSLTGSSYGYNGTVAVTGGSLTLNSGSALEFATVNTSSAGGSLLFSSTSATIGNLTGDGNVALTSAGSPVALTVGNASTNATYSGALSGSGSLTKSGFGTFTLAGANTFTGDTTINDGTLALGASGSLTGDVNLNSGGTLSLGNATGLQNSTVNLEGGNLSYGSGVNAVTFGGLAGSYDLNLPSTSLTVGGNNADTSYSGTVYNSGTFIKAGDGNLTFGGSFNNPAPVRLDAGTFTLANSSALENSNVTLNGGALSFGLLENATFNGLSGSTNLTLANTASSPAAVALTIDSTNGDSTYAGVLSGAGSLVKRGFANFTITGANTFTGDTTVDGGQLSISSTGSLTGDVNITGGSLSLANPDGLQTSTVHLTAEGGITFDGINVAQFGGLSGDRELSLSAANAPEDAVALTVGANNLDTTFSGGISGDGSLIKTGTGTLTLQGDAYYNGSTTVSAGTLAFNNKSAFYNSPNDEVLDSSNAARLSVAAEATATFYVDTTVTDSNGFLDPSDEDFVLTTSDQFTEVDIIALLQHASFAEGAILGVDTTDAIGGEVTFQQLDYIGDLGLTKSGAGDLVLDTELGISGPTTITGGQLVLANSYALANSTVTTTAGLAFNTDEVTLGGISGSESLSLTDINDFAVDLNVGANDTDTTFSGEISGGGELRKIGDGTLTLSGANTYTGDTTVANGTLVLASDNALGATSSVQIETDGTLDLNDHSVTIATLNGEGNIDLGSANLTTGDANNLELSGTISGTGSLTKEGTGELTLAGNNTYEGTTTVSEGTLTLRSDTALGTTAGGTTVASGATLAFSNNITVGAEAIANAGTVTNTSATNSYAGVLSGTGNLTVTDGSLTLSGANTYSGATAVNGGTLILGSANALGATSSVDIVSGATLDLNNHSVTLADLDGAGAVALGSATLTTGDTNTHALSGVISGTGGLIKTGSGSLTLSGDNTFSGPTTVNGGSLSIAADSALGTAPGSATAGQLTLNGGTVATTDSFALGANRGIELGSSGGTIETADATTLTYAGIIDGSGSFTKTGAGNLTLTGQSTYTGNTTIAGGTLTLDNASDDALVTTTDVTITNGGTLNMGTYSDHVDEVFLVDGTITAPSSGAFLFANAFNVQSGSITTTIDDVSGTGTLTKTTSGTVTLTKAAQYNGATDIQAGTFIVTGSDASINSTSALTIGNADAATVTVSDGGLIVTNALTLGDTSAGTGTLNITAPAGIFTVTSLGDAIIGNEGAGHVAISGGGSLGTVANLILAAGSNGTATVTVAGNDGNSQPSFIAALGSLIVAEGANSTATLTVSDGARAFVDGGMVIGAGSNSSGTVTITGANSVLTSASFGEPTVLTVALGTGTGSTGNLNLLNGATATLADTGSIDGLTAGPGSANVTINNATLATVAGGALTSNVALTTAGTATLATDTGTMILSGAISGTGAVTKTGTGTLSLSGTNSYQGATNVSEGTLTLAADAALGSTASGTTVASGATLAFTNNIAVGAEAIDSSGTIVNSSGDNTYAGVLSGTGNLAVTGGSLTLSGGSYAVDGESLVITGDNTYTGATTIASGASLAFAGPFDPTSTDDPYNVLFGLFENGAPERFLTTSGIVNQGTLALNGVGYLANGSAITGGGDLTVSGVSAAVLQANGNQLGDVTVGSAATMVMAGDTTFTSLEVNNGLFSAEGGTSSINGSVDLGNDGTTGRGILEVWGAGTSLDITGNIANHGTAQVRVNGGQLSVTGNVNFAGTTNQADFEVSNGGSATIGGNLVLNGTLTSQGENVSPLGYMVASVRENSSLRVDGAIQLGLDAGTSGILNIEGALQIGGTNGIITGAGETEVNLGNGILQVIGSDLTTSADMNLTWNPSAGTGTIDTNGFNAALSGALSGNGSLTKTGTGTLTLGGTNTYAGSTIVSGGTLALGADGTIANSAGVALGDGGILDLTAKSAGFTFGVDQTLSGSGTVNLAEGQTLTLAGMLAPGNSPGIITIDGNLVLNSSAVIAMELAPYGDRGGDSVDFDIIDVFGDLTLGGTLTLSGYGGYIPQVGDSFQLFYADSIGGSFAAINFTGFNGTVTFDTASLSSGLLSIASVSAVPEPATAAALLGLVTLGFAATRRRRRA